MKKTYLMMLAGLLVVACEKPVLGEVEDEGELPLKWGVRTM